MFLKEVLCRVPCPGACFIMPHHLLVTEPSICIILSQQKSATILAGTSFLLDYFLCGNQSC